MRYGAGGAVGGGSGRNSGWVVKGDVRHVGVVRRKFVWTDEESRAGWYAGESQRRQRDAAKQLESVEMMDRRNDSGDGCAHTRLVTTFVLSLCTKPRLSSLLSLSRHPASPLAAECSVFTRSIPPAPPCRRNDLPSADQRVVLPRSSTRPVSYRSRTPNRAAGPALSARRTRACCPRARRCR